MENFVFLDDAGDDSDDNDEEQYSGYVYEANKVDASDIVVAINRTGPMDFKLPETKAKHQVEMGEAGRFFVFDTKTASILKLEESQVIPYGVYQIKVTIA